MLGLGSSLAKGGASLLTFVKDNLKLYLDFKSNKSDTLKFPSEGSTSVGGFNQTRYIDLGSDIEFTGEFSIGFWFNGDVNTDYKVIARTTTSPSNDILVKDFNGQIAIRVGGNYSANANNVPNNTWSHIVFTRDSNNLITAYVNGTSSNTNTRSGTFKFSKIGSNIYSGGADCKLANFFAYNRCLAIEEVQSIQNKSYSQLKGVEKTSLVSWWGLDSASNGVVQPATGETLGSEKITSNTASDWTDFVSNGTEPIKTTTTNGVSLKSQGDSRAAYHTITGCTNGSLYKVVFNARTDLTDSNVKIYFNASTTYFTPVISTADTQYTIYGYAGSSNALQITGLDTGTTIFIENFSVKEVTSNTGVLK